METPRVRLGELLVKSGLLTQEQLEEALALQKQDGRRLGTLLVESGLVTETQVTQVLSQQLSVPWVSLHHIDFSRQLLNLVPDEVACTYCLIPIYVRRVRGLGDALYVAMDDPTNGEALDKVASYSGLHVRAMIAPPSDIRSAIEAYYGRKTTEDRDASTAEEERPEPPSTAAPSTHQEPDQEDFRKPRAEPPPPDSPPPSPQAHAAAAAAAGSADAAPAPDQPIAGSVAVREAGMPQPKGGVGARLIALTLLDGTTINLPARPAASKKGAATDDAEDHLTARDLVAALRAAGHGADATEILGEEPRWESMFAALLSLLLKKHLIADWEFIDEYKTG